jgi:hypothetical protein
MTTGHLNRQRMLLVYQTPNMKSMVARCGDIVVGLDATYKTTKYGLPLFLLVVRTTDTEDD